MTVLLMMNAQYAQGHKNLILSYLSVFTRNIFYFLLVHMIFIYRILENFHLSVLAVGQPGLYGQLILLP